MNTDSPSEAPGEVPRANLPASRAADAYRTQKIQTEAGALRVLDGYEVALAACMRKDAERVIGAIELLLDALDYEDGVLAEKYETVYVHCLALVPTGDFEEVARIFRRLKDAWAASLEAQ